MRLLVFVLLVLMLPVRAFADEAEDRAEAGREFNAGQAADRQKDWAAAIGHYIRANDLVPHPNTMFNIATDYERLGKLRLAAVWYQRYIAGAEDAPDRERVSRLLRDIQQRPSTITVTTTPPGARMSIDGVFAGPTPYTGKVKGGPHRLTFEYDGGRETRDVAAEYGEPLVVDHQLRGETGVLRVVGAPPGAVITVDDGPGGTTDPSGIATLDVPPGSHVIKVTAYGYTPYETTTDIRPRQTTMVRATRNRALGFDSPTNRTIRAGYLLGFGAGADIKGDVVALLDLGVQAVRYDIAVRIGKAAGLTAVDIVVRGALGKGRLAPYIGGGYAFLINNDDSGSGSSATSSLGGYVAVAGLRYEVSRSEHMLLAGILESGFRYYSGLSQASADGVEGRSGFVVPLMASLQVVYK